MKLIHAQLAVSGDPWQDQPMMLWHRLLFRAAVRAASDPRLQAGARDVFDKEVRPRVEDAWRRAEPRLGAARSDLLDAAKAADPRRDPGRFAGEVIKRWRRR
jgi:hypothetical protein